ncbi:ABC transporter permease subunit [Telmatocola sphagniphila]|uniref:ABC transporter permease subunit n=1 Tax=Telmatocola sphagniphila TaxID=1123043 RepID=A0A8E6EUZ1_9BACT|nr:ABC transporter permease subunit [Telmatocola sphagniphila]QVL32035.1 ABC transporter permease subunit [Telmatocola sphagniphila]
MKRHWIGPILGWEIVRLGRRGNITLLRTIVAIIILLALYVYYIVEYPSAAAFQFWIQQQQIISGKMLQPLNEFRFATKILESISRKFNEYLLILEVGLIFLLTPIYIAGAIAEERDRKTLEFLLSTDLSSWEIIVGKLGSRLIQLASVLLVCIPVISILQMWGGVNFPLVIAAFGIALVSMFSVATASLYMTLRCTSLVRSVLWSYALIVAFHMLIPLLQFVGAFAFDETWSLLPPASGLAFMQILTVKPYLLVDQPPEFWNFLLVFLLSNLAIAIVCIWDSTRKLRKLAFIERPRKVVERKRANPEHRHWADPPVIKEGEDGLYWKEKHFTGSQNRFIKQFSLIPTWMWIAIVVTLGMVLITGFSNDISNSTPAITKIAGLIFVFLGMMIAGMAACASIARERQKETLVDLVMIPTDRKDILKAKWWGSLAQGKSTFGGYLSLLFVAMLCYGISYLTLPGLCLLAWAWCSVAISVGVWLSIRCKSVQRASAFWFLIMMVGFGGNYLLTYTIRQAWELDTTFNPSRPWEFNRQQNQLVFGIIDKPVANEILVASSPILTWDRLSFQTQGENYYNYYGQQSFLSNPLMLLAPLLNIAIMLILSRCFWSRAWQKFETETYK